MYFSLKIIVSVKYLLDKDGYGSISSAFCKGVKAKDNNFSLFTGLQKIENKLLEC